MERGRSNENEASSPSLATFDVNKFLKKTFFSDYDIADRGDHVFEPESSSSDPKQKRGRFRSEFLDNENQHVSALDRSFSKENQRKKTPQRRAGSVPSTSQDRIQNNRSSIIGDIDARERKRELDDRLSIDRSVDSRRSRRRDRCPSCAYCGQEIAGRSSTNANSSSNSNSNHLYCAACTSFFTRHSPAELQRRIAYDEMTRPIGVKIDQDKELAPLLSNAGKVVLATNLDESDRENVDNDVIEATAEKDPVRRDDDQGGLAHRYARNDRRQGGGRGHGGRPQVKTVPAQREQQQLLRPGRSRDDYSKTNFLFGESSSLAPVTVWTKDGQGGGNSRRSSCTSASSMNRPTCRICHLYGEPGDNLVSPCRCAGTMQYVHTSCLVHWLEISTKKVLPSPQCELCGYHYRTHHCYRFRRMHAPSCNRRDRVLHAVFVIMLLVMLGCSALSAVYLRQDKGSGYKRAALSSDDIIVIASALLFFCAFFVAVFTQYRAETPVCRLCLRCWLINRHWRVKDYDKNLDYERRSKIGGHSSIVEQI